MIALFLDQWFLLGLAAEGLPPEDIWQCRKHFWFVSPAGEILLTSSRQGPGMMLKLLRYTGQPPQQRINQPKLTIMLRLRNPALNGHFKVNEQSF